MNIKEIQTLDDVKEYLQDRELGEYLVRKTNQEKIEDALDYIRQAFHYIQQAVSLLKE